MKTVVATIRPFYFVNKHPKIKQKCFFKYCFQKFELIESVIWKLMIPTMKKIVVQQQFTEIILIIASKCYKKQSYTMALFANQL